MSDRPHYDIYLSYSGRKCYLSCPRKYYFSYVMRLPQKWNLPDTAYGKAIGKVFEWFYNNRLWSTPDVVGSTLATADSATREIFSEEKTSVADYRDLFNRVVEELQVAIPKFVDIIRKHRLLTESSRSEVDLTQVYTSPKHDVTLKLGGRADFVHGVNRSTWIVDGKASRHRERYVDSDQLVWYAVLHYIKYGVAPSRLGFLYYRFPDDPIQWIAYDAAAMRTCVDQTFEIAGKIKLKMFEPKTGPECSRCDFKDRCDDGSKYVAAKKVESGGRIESSIFGLDPI